ncbi:TetR family transcriptional regulator C-terminal domain-containing protein [Actinomadura harenae]|uniref:TetR family transcriptional regulator C-terminal domain-containing protein n=1 Tax=Actinomadura harenae TaxID=2483351 RepID=UPI001F2D4B71|nr:TetR family transcriptional regulator C-terminal domain-containing protein [Actinomadura harenae]
MHAIVRGVLLELLPVDEERRTRHLVHAAYFIRFLADRDLAKVARDAPHALEDLVAGLIAQGQESGQVPQHVDATAEAAFLVAGTEGLQSSVLLRQRTAAGVRPGRGHGSAAGLFALADASGEGDRVCRDRARVCRARAGTRRFAQRWHRPVGRRRGDQRSPAVRSPSAPSPRDPPAERARRPVRSASEAGWRRRSLMTAATYELWRAAQFWHREIARPCSAGSPRRVLTIVWMRLIGERSAGGGTVMPEASPGDLNQ